MIKNNKIKVLIIDNEKDGIVSQMQDFVRKNFEGSDCQIIDDIDYNSEIIIQQKPDIIIVDIALSEDDENFLNKIQPSDTSDPLQNKLSGIVYCIKIKSNFPNIPVLLASKHYSANVVTQVIEANADGFLYKRNLFEGHFIASITAMLNRYKTKDVYFYEKLRKLLEKDEIDAWNRKHMSKALEAFFSYGSTTRRLSGLWCELSSLIEKIIPSKTVNKLIQALINAESIILASSPNMRDHVLHAGNVFWMGYYLLNCIPKFRTPEVLSGYSATLFKNSDMDPFEHLNIVWMLSALLHDIGYICEKTEIIEQKINSVYSLFNHSIETKKHPHVDNSNDLNILNDFLSEFGSNGTTLNTAIVAALEQQENDNSFSDHGINSAAALVSLLNQHSNAKKFLKNPIILHATATIALHNLSKWNRKSWITKFNKDGIMLSIGTLPCAWLLAFCDELQNWSRETEGDLISDSDTTEIEKTLNDAYINNSILSSFELIENLETELNFQIKMEMQYMLVQGKEGNNADEVCKALKRKILEWDRDKKQSFVKTLSLEKTIRSNIKHWLPNSDDPIKIEI